MNDIHLLLPKPAQLCIDNTALVKWCKSRITKNLRYYNIRENCIREAVIEKGIEILHIPGAINISDLFIKGNTYDDMFVKLRNLVCTLPPADATNSS